MEDIDSGIPSLGQNMTINCYLAMIDYCVKQSFKPTTYNSIVASLNYHSGQKFPIY